MKRLVLLVLLAACADDPLAVDDVRPATATEVERALSLYGQTAECLGLPDHGRRVHWWIASTLIFDGETRRGASRGDDIWIAEIFAAHSWVWRHESMHHILLRATGDPDADHRDPRWSRCADR